MATINLKTDEFQNFLLLSLFDLYMNQEQIKNDILKDFIDKHGNQIKASLIKAYLDSDSEMRLNYKRIRGIFDGSDTSMQQIRINQNKVDKDNNKKKKGLIKKVLKKILSNKELNITDKKILKEIVEN